MDIDLVTKWFDEKQLARDSLKYFMIYTYILNVSKLCKYMWTILTYFRFSNSLNELKYFKTFNIVQHNLYFKQLVETMQNI